MATTTIWVRGSRDAVREDLELLLEGDGVTFDVEEVLFVLDSDRISRVTLDEDKVGENAVYLLGDMAGYQVWTTQPGFCMCHGRGCLACGGCGLVPAPEGGYPSPPINVDAWRREAALAVIDVAKKLTLAGFGNHGAWASPADMESERVLVRALRAAPLAMRKAAGVHVGKTVRRVYAYATGRLVRATRDAWDVKLTNGERVRHFDQMEALYRARRWNGLRFGALRSDVAGIVHVTIKTSMWQAPAGAKDAAA